MRVLLLFIMAFLVACTVVIVSGGENDVRVDKKLDRELKVNINKDR